MLVLAAKLPVIGAISLKGSRALTPGAFYGGGTLECWNRDELKNMFALLSGRAGNG
jgi:hypothetical protein